MLTVKLSDCVAHQIEGHVGEPVDGGDDIGEEDELGLVVGARKLPRLERVHGGAKDQHERVGQPGDDARKRKLT